MATHQMGSWNSLPRGTNDNIHCTNPSDFTTRGLAKSKEHLKCFNQLAFKITLASIFKIENFKVTFCLNNVAY